MHSDDEVTHNYSERMVQRCLGLLTPDQLRTLSQAVIAGAGAGGVGGWTYLALARFGCRHFRLTDPEGFDLSNVNRQAGCACDTLGRNKAEVIAGEIRRINPQARVDVVPGGLTRQTARPLAA